MIPKLYYNVVLGNGGLFLSRDEFTKPDENTESVLLLYGEKTDLWFGYVF
jgi:hypothetical protein